MRLCVYEDRRVASLEPLSLTRPAFDLLCGTCSLLERQARALKADQVGALVRPYLADLCRAERPGMAVNDRDWLGQGPTVLVNGRWLAPPAVSADLTTPCVGLVGEEVAFVVLPAAAPADLSFENIDERVQSWKSSLPQVEAGGVLATYLWQLVDHNARLLCEDIAWRRAEPTFGPAPEHLAVVGPRVDVLVATDARIDPYVVADSRGGPVIIDRGAVIHAFTRLEGPCYVGPGTWLVGGKLRGGTLGPVCRVGGEVEATVVQGYSNKYHDGFLGHSYVGEWVNLAAGTQVSDLRNDYGQVSVRVNGEPVKTGLTKVGAFIGDHTRTGLNVLLNTGSVVGVLAGVLPTGELLPRLIPSFCTLSQGQLQERRELRQLLQTADTVMRRRGRELTAAHTELFFTLYEQTAAQRGRVIREQEQRRVRRSLSS